LLWSAFSCTN